MSAFNKQKSILTARKKKKKGIKKERVNLFIDYHSYLDDEEPGPIGSPDGSITICGIDPGTDSCGVVIMTYHTDGSHTTRYANVFDFDSDEYQKGKAYNQDKSAKVYSGFHEAFAHLKGLLRECHFIAIEEQLVDFTKNIRIEQHITSHIMTVTHNRGFRPVIVRVSAKQKYALTSCPAVQDKKTWAVERAIEYYMTSISCLERLVKDNLISEFQLKKEEFELEWFEGSRSKMNHALLGRRFKGCNEKLELLYDKRREDIADAILLVRCTVELIKNGELDCPEY